MREEEIKIRVSLLITLKEEIDKYIRHAVYDFAKSEGLVSASHEDVDNFNYKKIIRNELGLEI